MVRGTWTLAQGNDGMVQTSAADLTNWGGNLVEKNSLVGSRDRAVKKCGGSNDKDGEVVWLSLSTSKCLEKERAENDSQASESWWWKPGSRPQKGSCLLRSGPGPSPTAAKFQRLNPHPRQVCWDKVRVLQDNDTQHRPRLCSWP